jgi:hypothetical protein
VADDVVAGCWVLQAGLEGRPPGEVPEAVAGASPAYDLRERPGLVRVVTVERRPIAVRLAHAGDPAPATLFEAARARNPYARPGWTPDATAPVVLVDAGGSPIAAAALAIDAAAHLAVATAITVAADAPDSAGAAAAGADLVDAVEALALDGGAAAIRFDETAFLVDPAVLRLADRGYFVGPPYDGDADVAVWAERRLAG